jgi:ankyrin repeat protein
VEILVALLDRTTENINIGNVTQKTPLHLAVERKHLGTKMK